MHRFIVAVFSTGILAACAGASAERASLADKHAHNDAKVAAELQGLKPSPPQNCIDSYRLRNVSGEPYGDTLLYRINSTLVYRNDTSGACYGLDRGDTLIDQFYPGNKYGRTELCRGDPLYSRNLRQSAPTGSCTRGAWVAYTK